MIKNSKSKHKISILITLLLVFIAILSGIFFSSKKQTTQSSEASAAPVTSFKIMTYNIKLSRGEKLRQIGSFAVGKQIDIIGLQEFGATEGDDAKLAKGLTDHLNVVSSASPTWNNYFYLNEEDNAVLWSGGSAIFSHLPLLEGSGIGYRIDQPDKTGNNHYRLISTAKVDLGDGNIVRIVSMHPPHSDPNCETGKKYIPYINQFSAEPTFIMGDFNAVKYTDKCYKDMIENKYIDTCDPTKDQSCSDSVTSTTENYAIDFIFMNPKAAEKWEVSKAYIDHTMLNSDHFPAISEFELKNVVTATPTPTATPIPSETVTPIPSATISVTPTPSATQTPVKKFDFNKDGNVCIVDFVKFINFYKTKNLQVDGNGDSLVNIRDFLVFRNEYINDLGNCSQ